MSIISFLVYNFIFVPVFYLMVHLGAPFSSKLRKGLWGRYRLHSMLRRAKSTFKGKPVLVIHCASMGEFEHVKPFIIEFKKQMPKYCVVVLFFSPSGFDNVKFFPEVDLFVYSPFDWIIPLWRFIREIRPTVWVIAKHDVWPDQVWFTRLFKIPCILINASLNEQSSRLLWFTLTFHRAIYTHFTKILTVSQEDRQNFLELTSPLKLIVAGDTKYDQVLYRRDEFSKMKIIPEEIINKCWVFVAGSTWPEDQQHLFKAIKFLRKEFSNLLTIICPHEPTEQHLQEVFEEFKSDEILPLSNIQNFSGHSVILVNQIGVLANLYGLGKTAYVGGSFKQNVHNVLEPAVYKIPVLFGPVNRNSHEAQLLRANGGGWEVLGSEQIAFLIRKFLLNDVYRQESGLKAYHVVEENRGATQRTVENILPYLPVS